MSHYEIEIKSLLGTKDKAEELVSRMLDIDPDIKIVGESCQLNHYFIGGNIQELYKKVEHLFSGDQHKKFEMIAEKGKEFSVRTRQKDDEVLLVVKASLDGGTSSNSISRMEFEEPVAITLDELDKLVESAGFHYEAKWSRDRVEYAFKDINVCLDKNAGYGYLAEFEIVTDDENSLPEAREKLKNIMKEVEMEELPQDRLARMFAYYNENWPDYYGTDKTFNIE
jgi:adenylate cyclase class IV